MSAFTSGGFAPTEKELRTPGSKHTDGIYRGARIEGFDQGAATLRVYLEGAREGGHSEQIVSGALMTTAWTIYSVEKAAGRHHGEALDEVFLAGYAAAKAGAFS